MARGTYYFTEDEEVKSGSNKIYQIVISDISLDNWYEYGYLFRTKDGAVKYIKKVLGFHEVYVPDSDQKIWYMDPDLFEEGGTYNFSQVVEGPEALVVEHELRD